MRITSFEVLITGILWQLINDTLKLTVTLNDQTYQILHYKPIM